MKNLDRLVIYSPRRGLVLIALCVLGAALVTLPMGCRERASSHGVAKAVKYTCPMHPSVVSDRPGPCPICGMDLVLVDLSFPPDPATIGGRQQDGFYFIDWIHRTPEVAKPPLGIISSMDPALYRERAEHAGVRVCLQKPLDKEALVAAVRAVLEGA